MGNVFGSFSLTKRKALLAVLVTLLVFHRRIINKMKERHRAYVLMKLIPAPKLPAGQKENLLLSNAVTYYISNKNIFNSAEEVQKKALKGLRKILEDNPKMKEVGVINIPVFAGWMERSNPFHIVSFPIVIGNDKVKEFLSAKAMGYYSKGSSYQVSHSLIGDSVLSTSGKIWHTQRKIAEKGFTDEIMVYAVPKICKTVNELTEKLKNRLLSKPYSVHEEMLKLTMDVLGRVAMSYDFQSVTAETTSDAPLYNAFNDILNTLNRRCIFVFYHWLRWLPTRRNLRYNAYMNKLDSKVEELIETRKKERENGISHQSDLLDVLLSANTANQMDRQTLVDNLKTILFAGHDTTAAALSWLLFLLVENPEIMQKLRDEIESHFPESKNGSSISPDVETMEKMDYLNACVQEVLRLYPSAGFSRNILREFTFKDGTKLPAGIEVFLFPYITQRMEENYENPDSFIPERWLTTSKNLTLQAKIGLESTKAESIKYFPFSSGPRNCVGRKLALLEIRVVIINLVTQFDFKIAEDSEFQRDPVVYLTLNPASIKLIPTIRAHS